MSRVKLTKRDIFYGTRSMCIDQGYMEMYSLKIP